MKVSKEGRKSHFFGSIVSVYNPDGQMEEHLIIDGQQRLTTVSLLFLALYNLIQESKVMPQSPHLEQKLLEEYLVDKYQPKETRIKLKPIKNDRAAFERLFDQSDGSIADSNLTINYTYFYGRIQRGEITPDALFDAISKLEIINIRLNQDDNPQLIFESLNSTGQDLSEGDKMPSYHQIWLNAKVTSDISQHPRLRQRNFRFGHNPAKSAAKQRIIPPNGTLACLKSATPQPP